MFFFSNHCGLSTTKIERNIGCKPLIIMWQHNEIQYFWFDIITEIIFVKIVRCIQNKAKLYFIFYVGSFFNDLFYLIHPIFIDTTWQITVINYWTSPPLEIHSSQWDSDSLEEEGEERRKVFSGLHHLPLTLHFLQPLLLTM